MPAIMSEVKTNIEQGTRMFNWLLQLNNKLKGMQIVIEQTQCGVKRHGLKKEPVYVYSIVKDYLDNSVNRFIEVGRLMSEDQVLIFLDGIDVGLNLVNNLANK